MPRSVKILGPKVKAAREAAFLTQTQLGEKLEPAMSDENIGRIERSQVAGILSKNIPQLAAALKVPLEVFQRDFVVADVEKLAADRGRGAARLIDMLEVGAEALPDVERFAAQQGWSVDQMLIAIFDLGMKAWREGGYRIEDDSPRTKVKRGKPGDQVTLITVEKVEVTGHRPRRMIDRPTGEGRAGG